MFSLLIYPMANYSFFLRAIKRLYFAKTKDKKLFEFFKKKHNNVFQQFYQKYDSGISDYENKDLRIIDFSNYDSLCLYLALQFGKFFCFKNWWPKYTKMMKTLK